MRREGGPSPERPEITEYNSLDRETIERFSRAYSTNINLLSIDLPKTMGFDDQIVAAQRVIDIAERKGLMEDLYKAANAENTADLIDKLANAPKVGRVGDTLGGISRKAGITFEDLMDQKTQVAAFLKTIDNPEGVAKLKEALDKLGY